MNTDRLILQDHVHKFTENPIYQGHQQSFVLFSYLIGDLTLRSPLNMLPGCFQWQSLLSLKTTKFLLWWRDCYSILSHIELKILCLVTFTGPRMPFWLTRMPPAFSTWQLFFPER